MGGDLRDFASLPLGNAREATLHAGIDLDIVRNPEPRAQRWRDSPAIVVPDKMMPFLVERAE